jgi:DNA polymerase-1
MLPGFFQEIVAVDFEFTALPGERPGPICVVAQELGSGRRFRIFQDQFPSSPPWATGSCVLTLAYFSSSDWNCYRAQNWPLPEHIIDLFVEFRWLTNGLSPPGAKLINVLTYFGLDAMNAVEKKELQDALGNNT